MTCRKCVKKVGGKHIIENEKKLSIYVQSVHVKLTYYKKDLSQRLVGRKDLKCFMLVEVYTYCIFLKNQTYLHIIYRVSLS